MAQEKGPYDTEEFPEDYYDKELETILQKIEAAESFEELVDKKVLDTNTFKDAIERINETREALKSIKMDPEKIKELLDSEDLFSQLSLDPKINSALKSKLVWLLKKELALH